MENIEWDKLEKTRVERIVSTTFVETILPEGVYKCPHCDGEGKAMTIHRMFGSHKYGICGMCKGTCEIRKCTQCNINPIPNDNNTLRCLECYEIYSKRLREEFMERVNKGGK